MLVYMAEVISVPSRRVKTYKVFCVLALRVAKNCFYQPILSPYLRVEKGMRYFDRKSCKITLKGVDTGISTEFG